MSGTPKPPTNSFLKINKLRRAKPVKITQPLFIKKAWLNTQAEALAAMRKKGGNQYKPFVQLINVLKLITYNGSEFYQNTLTESCPGTNSAMLTIRTIQLHQIDD